MSFFVHKNLNPRHPREGIEGKMSHHTDLILPWTWNQVGMVDWRIWGLEGGRARKGRAEHGVVRMSELLGERKSDLNDVGPKIVESAPNRSDRLPRPVRPVWPRLTESNLSW